MNRVPHAVIIGAGLSGLACAYHLKKAGYNYTILESSDSPGGRVRTDIVDEFVLDRGFQVLLTAYPEAREMLDYDKLELKPFIPGAMVRFNGEFHTVADPWRKPTYSLKSVFNPIGTLKDKLLIAKLRETVAHKTLKALYERKEQTTLSYLQQFGFSNQIIDRFFRPFFGGVFFDRALSTSSKMFEFTFRMFATGDTSLPTGGMGAISRQLYEKIDCEKVQFNVKVKEVSENLVILEDGAVLQTDAVVVATEGPEAMRLLKKTSANLVGNMKSTRCVYFAANKAPIKEPILVLNGDESELINNLCVPSNVNPSYAPPGKSLVSVSVVGRDDLTDADLVNAVVKQLEDWFGKEVTTWRHLKTYNIKYGLPDFSAPALGTVEKNVRVEKGLYVCGDHRDTASINGALACGRRAANALIDDFETTLKSVAS